MLIPSVWFLYQALYNIMKGERSRFGLDAFLLRKKQTRPWRTRLMGILVLLASIEFFIAAYYWTKIYILPGLVE